MVEMVTVVSNTIEAVGYDDATETLTIQFIKGGIYEYRGVPRLLYDEMLGSTSVGSFLHANIKGIYPYDRIG